MDETKGVVGEIPSKKNVLGKDAILGSKDIQLIEVDVPEWGGTVLVKGLSGEERDAFEASMLKGEGKKQKVDTQNIRAKLCSLAIVNEKGERIFSDLASIAALGKKSATALSRVYDIAAKESGLRDEDIEDLVKNSGSAQLVV